MHTDVPANATPELAELERQRQAAHTAEDAARRHRHDLERQILAHPALPTLKPRGSNNFGVVCISTGDSRSWNQAALARYRAENPNITDEHWPFKTQYVEDVTAMRFLVERYPDYVRAIEDAALTIKTRKPSFKDGKLPDVA